MQDKIAQYQAGIVTDANTLVHAVGSSAYSFTLSKNSLYRVVSTTLCHIRMGTAATSQDATAAASAILPANVPIYVMTNATHIYLSVIRNTADGVMSATKLVPGTMLA